MKRICNIYLNGELVFIVREDFCDLILLLLRNLNYNDEDLFIEYEDVDVIEG